MDMYEFEPVQESQRRSSKLLRTLLWLPLLAAAFYFGLTLNQWRSGGPEEATSPLAQPREVQRADLRSDELHTIEIFQQAAPSVVFITTLERRRVGFTRLVTETPTGSGTGFVWNADGQIVTNYHVIRSVGRGAKVQVTLADQSEWEATVMGAAPEKDLALLKIDAPRNLLRPIPLGSSRDLQVGQSVYAIGNPFGLDQSLTTGIISALGREIDTFEDRTINNVIQTDAAINPGNSGGPLLDSSGRLIGVNTAIYSPSGASAGIGFAIPVDTVNWVVPDLISFGAIDRPTLGLAWWDDQYLRRLGKTGVLVLEVGRNTGADRAGLRSSDVRGRRVVRLGDIIVGVEGETVENFDDLMRALEPYNEGDQVEITVERDERMVELDVVLGPSNARRQRGR